MLYLCKYGQGTGDTRWKGWAWKLLLTKLVIYSYYKEKSN